MKFMFVPRNVRFDNEEQVQGLIRFCKKTGAEEAMVHSRISPWAPKDANLERADRAKKAFHVLNEHGIRVSDQIVSLMRPDDRGPVFPQTMVTRANREDRSPCPLDATYREYTAFLFSKLATTGACKIFLDDDFGHLHATRDTCFCPLHIAEFNKRYGYDFDREGLVQKLAEDPMGKVQLDWLDLQADVLVELASLMERAAHAENPEVRLGLMITCSDITSYSGKTHEVLRALAGDLQPLVRTGMGWYQDYNRLYFINELTDVLYQHSLVPENTEMYSEIDAVPHGLFSKGIRVCFDYSIKANMICGTGTHSVSWLDAGERLDEDYRHIEQINEKLKVDRAIAQVIPDRAVRRGLGVIENMIGRRMHAQGPILFNRENGELVALWRMGIPITFDDSDTAFLTRNSILFEPDEVERRFAEKNLLLDLDSLLALREKGMGELAGVEVKGLLDKRGQFGRRGWTEELTDHPVNGRYAGETVRLRLFRSAKFAQLAASSSGGVSVSRVRNPDDEEVGSGPILLEGGGRRRVVLPYSLKELQDYRHGCMSMFNKEQLKGMVEWLSGGHLPAFIDDVADVCPSVLVDPDTGRTTIGLLNFSYDPARGCDLYVEKATDGPYALEYVTDDGSMEAVPESNYKEENGYLVIRLTKETGANPFDLRVLTVTPRPE